MARRSVKQRGGGQVQGFLEEDTWLIRGNCFQVFSPDVLYYCLFLAYSWIHTCAGILPGSSSAPRLYFLASLMSSVSSLCMVL